MSIYKFLCQICHFSGICSICVKRDLNGNVVLLPGGNVGQGYVLIATDKPFNPATVQKMNAMLQADGLETVLLEGPYSSELFIDALQGASYLIVRGDKVDRHILENSNGLKQIVRAGTGTEKIDARYASERGIWVENTPGQNSNSVAELTLGYIFSHARNLHSGYYNAQQGTPLPKDLMGHELAELKIGLQGFGQIGKLVSKKLHLLGAQAAVFDPITPSKRDIRKYGIASKDIPEEIYERADVVSLHFPPEGGNDGTVDYDLIRRMGESGFLINTARPGVVNHADLSRIMEARPNFWYAIDCTTNEFPQEPGLNPHLRRVLWTNKWGSQTYKANDNTGIAAVRQVAYFHKTGTPTHPVNHVQ